MKNNFKKRVRVVFIGCLAAVAISLLSGCGMSHKAQLEKTYEKNVKTVLKPSPDLVREGLKEIAKEKKYISFRHPQKLSDVLVSLSEIEGKTYVLDLGTKDIDVPTLRSSSFKVSNFYGLKDYLVYRTNYTIKISKNKFFKNKPKIVTVLDKKDIKFLEMKPQLSGKNTTLADALDDVVQTTGYNIAYLQDDGATRVGGSETKNEVDFLHIKHFSFKPNKNTTVSDVLNYVSEAINVYVDIDHINKLIKIGKYKVKYYKLSINNLDIQGSMEAKTSSSSDSGSSSSNDAIPTNELELNIFEELKTALDSVLKKNNEFDKSNAYCEIDKVTGEVTAKASKKSMDQIEEMIQRFNSTYGKKGVLYIDAIEVLVERDVNGGLDIQGLNETLSKRFSFGAGTAFNGSNPVSTFSYSGANSFGQITADLVNEFGEIVDKNKYTIQLTNHLPRYRKKQTTKKYTSKITTVQTGTNSNGTPLYNIERETSEVYDGYAISVLPMIDGDEVSLNINASFSSVVNMKERAVGDETYEEPEISTDSFSGEFKMRDGECTILDSLSAKGRTENYRGIVPIKDFIIGGNTDDNYVKREIVMRACYQSK